MAVVAADPQFSRDGAKVLSALAGGDLDIYDYMQGEIRSATSLDQLPERAKEIWKTVLDKHAKSVVHVEPYVREGHPVSGYDRSLFNRLAEPLKGMTVKFEETGGSPAMPQTFRYLNVDDANGMRVGQINYGFDKETGGINIHGIAVKDTMRGRGIAVAMAARLHEQFGKPLIHGSFSSLDGVRFGVFMAAAYPEWNKLWLNVDDDGKLVFWKPGDPIPAPQIEASDTEDGPPALDTFGPLRYGSYPLVASTIEQALASAAKVRAGGKDMPDGETKAQVHVRPYIREGRPVIGYEREQQLAEEAAHVVEELIQGASKRGGQGRRGLKRPRKGWLDYVEQEHRTLFPLQQDALIRQRRAAQAVAGGAWEKIERPDGNNEYRKENYRIVYNERQVEGYDNPFGADVYQGDRYLGRVAPTAGKPAEEILREIVPHPYPEHERFLSDWWSEPGRPGEYQTMSGDPGLKFQDQHTRIMEAGARMDAELAYRTREEETTYKTLGKELARLRREMAAIMREADRIQGEEAARILIEEKGWTPEAATPKNIIKQVARSNREKAKIPNADMQVIFDTMDADQAWNRASLSDGVFAEIEKHGHLAAEADELARAEQAAYKTLVNARRDNAYNMLSQVRPFGTVKLDYTAESTDGSAAVHAAQFWLPSDWIAASNDSSQKLAVSWTDERGHYQHYAKSEPGKVGVSSISVSPSASPDVRMAGAQDAPRGVGTALHELVHRSEDVRDGIKGAEWTFYTSRVSPGINRKWEDTRPLRMLSPGSGYNEDEIARPDDFVNPYSGKDYANGYPDMDTDYEILSMGVEDLVTGQHKMLVKDDEYRQFVLGSLALL